MATFIASKVREAWKWSGTQLQGFKGTALYAYRVIMGVAKPTYATKPLNHKIPQKEEGYFVQSDSYRIRKPSDLCFCVFVTELGTLKEWSRQVRDYHNE